MSTILFPPFESPKKHAPTVVFGDDSGVDSLPVPVPMAKVNTKKRRKSVAVASPNDFEQLVKTPTKRAREIFKKLKDGEEVEEAKIERELGSSLNAFVSRGETLSLRIALEEGANPNWSTPVTALYTSVDLGQAECCKSLLKHGASVIKKNAANNRRPIDLALKKRGTAVYELFINRIRQMEEVYHSASGDSHVSLYDEEEYEEPPRKKMKTAF